MIAALIAFVSCSFLIVYHHVGYPLLLKLLAKQANTSIATESVLEADLPTIGLVIPIYNEESLIAEKLRNLAFLDYPSEKLTIHLVFDGCTDQSYDVARKSLQEPLLGSLNVSIHNSHDNLGKLAQLNKILPNITAEITALSDVSALLSIDSLKIAAQHFQNAEIGAVCATYRFMSNGAEQETGYWRYQCGIKQTESQLGSTLGAHGAFYLFRSELYSPLPTDTINDDFMLPCQVIQQNRKVIYEPEMVAVELEATQVEQDLKRRLRIGAGNFQQSIRLMPLLSPKYGMTAFMFFSCKWMRPFMPLMFLITLISSVSLTFYTIWFLPIVAAQVTVYSIAVLQHYLHLENGLFRKVHYVISAHFVNAVAVFHYLSGMYKTSWRKSHD